MIVVKLLFPPLLLGSVEVCEGNSEVEDGGGREVGDPELVAYDFGVRIDEEAAEEDIVATGGMKELFMSGEEAAKVDEEALDEEVVDLNSVDGDKVDLDPANIVVYAPSCVPSIEAQSTLKLPAAIFRQLPKSTKVALSVQYGPV